jgi:Phage integrase, N-terminal SAM-like domain
MLVPRVIAAAGDQAARRFLEFFAATIRNNTRQAYYHAVVRFFERCDRHKIGEIADIEPLHVAAYIEALGKDFEKPTVKQHLASIRMAVRLARHRPSRRHQPSPRGPWSEACSQDRQDDGAGRRSSAETSGQHRHIDDCRAARSGAH